MTEEYKQEGNELIAKFVGGEATNYMHTRCFINISKPKWLLNKGFVVPEQLKYHLDWDWLMLIVDKCSQEALKLGDESKFEAAEWMFLTNNIEAVWHKVVEFIKYYNNENTEG